MIYLALIALLMVGGSGVYIIWASTRTPND